MSGEVAWLCHLSTKHSLPLIPIMEIQLFYYFLLPLCFLQRRWFLKMARLCLWNMMRPGCIRKQPIWKNLPKTWKTKYFWILGTKSNCKPDTLGIGLKNPTTLSMWIFCITRFRCHRGHQCRQRAHSTLWTTCCCNRASWTCSWENVYHQRS